MISLPFVLRIEFLSDWHVGTGAGRGGDLDRLVARDDDSLPFVPAKTLTGILRDSAEQVAEALDETEGAGWARAAEALFGSQPSLSRVGDSRDAPTSARVSIGPAQYGFAVRAAIRERGLATSLTFGKPGVAIDPETGRARENFLRFEEMGRVGTVLFADGRIDLGDSDDAEVASALIRAAARLVERLGGKRRRGAGRCRITVASGLENIDVVKVLARPTAPTFERPARPAEIQPVPVMASGNGAWTVVALRITARSPLVCPAAVVGNVVECSDHVPGSYLLGLLASALAAAGIDVAAAIAANLLRVLPATVAHDGRPAWRAPLALHVTKGVRDDEDLPTVNALRATSQEVGDQRAIRESWVTPNGNLASKPTFVSVTHGTIDDEAQRPTADGGGGVFTYQGIAPGTLLASYVLVADELGAAALDAIAGLAGPARIGRSRKDDYGLVEINVGAAVPLRRATDASPPETAWCATDVVLRDDFLRPDTTVEGLIVALGSAIGANLAAQDVDGHARPCLRTNRLDGWQVSWSRPRPTLTTLAAGSCVRFAGAPGQVMVWELPDYTRIAFVGERQPEGFGVVVLDPPILTTGRPLLAKATRAGVVGTSVGVSRALDDGEQAFLATLEREHWRHELALQARSLSTAAPWRLANLGWGTNLPGHSQLGGLRQAVRSLGVFDPNNAAARWFERLQQVPNRARQWDAAKEQTHKLLTDPEHVYSLLLTRPPATNQSEPDEVTRRTLWGEAVRTLVDAALGVHLRDRLVSG